MTFKVRAYQTPALPAPRLSTPPLTHSQYHSQTLYNSPALTLQPTLPLPSHIHNPAPPLLALLEHHLPPPLFAINRIHKPPRLDTKPSIPLPRGGPITLRGDIHILPRIKLETRFRGVHLEVYVCLGVMEFRCETEGRGARVERDGGGVEVGEDEAVVDVGVGGEGEGFVCFEAGVGGGGDRKWNTALIQREMDIRRQDGGGAFNCRLAG